MTEKFKLSTISELEADRAENLRLFSSKLKEFNKVSPLKDLIPGNFYYFVYVGDKIKDAKAFKLTPHIVFVTDIKTDTFEGIDLLKYDVKDRVKFLNVLYNIDPLYFEETDTLINGKESIVHSDRLLDTLTIKHKRETFMKLIPDSQFTRYRMFMLYYIQIVPLSLWNSICLI